MGLTRWACFGCGQPMQLDHENGANVVLDLCPSCQEKAQGVKHQPKRRRDADPNDDGA